MKTVRILSIDGGGIRGIIPLKVLQYIEKKTGQPIHKLFDFIGGTSTGGIIALGLNCFMPGTQQIYPTDELLKFYTQDRQKLFAPRRWWTNILYRKSKYQDQPIENYLKLKFGLSTPISQLPTDCDVTVYSYDLVSNRPFHFNNNSDQRWHVWQAARSTSAAPSFFPAYRLVGDRSTLVLVDGGVYINNPAMDLLVRARRFEPDAEKQILVSIGTGNFTPSLVDKENAGAGWALDLKDPAAVFGLAMAGTSRQTEIELEELLSHRVWQEKYQYYRFQKEFDKDVAMDDVSKRNVELLVQLGENLVDENRDQLDRVCDKLCLDLNQRVSLPRIEV